MEVPGVERDPTPACGDTGVVGAPSSVAPTPDAVGVALRTLHGKDPLDDLVDAIGERLYRCAGVENVLVVLREVPPEDEDRWTRLASQTWLRQWLPPGAPGRATLSTDPSQEYAFPWLTRLSRTGLVAIADTADLPGAAASDQEALDELPIKAMAMVSLFADGYSFGALCLTRVAPGPWDQVVLADLQLLGAALTARLSALHDRDTLLTAMDHHEQYLLAHRRRYATLLSGLHTPAAALIEAAHTICEAARATDDPGRGTAQDPGPPGDYRSALVTLESASRQIHAVVSSLPDDTDIEIRDATAHGTRQPPAKSYLPGDTGPDDPGGPGSSDSPAVRDIGYLPGPHPAVNVHAAVADAVSWAAAAARAADVAIAIDVPTSLHVRAPETELRHALSALIAHAVAHSHAGGLVAVVAETVPTEPDATPRVRVSVYDTGPDLDEDQLRDICHPTSTTASAARPAKVPPLALTRLLVQGFGGHFGAGDTENPGASLWFEIDTAPHPD